MQSSRFVVVGGGPAAGAAARRFAEAGERVVVLTDEALAPYDRTVLSKEVLLSPDAAVPEVWPPGAPWLDRIVVRSRTRVVALDPQARVVTTADGATWAFERVVLAPGAAPRRLTITGADGPGVHHLRDVPDAHALADALSPGRRVVVVGGGLIGLEVAAAAALRGLDVEVVEAGPAILGRGVPAPVAAWLTALHAAHGVRIRTSAAPREILRDGSTVRGVRLGDGTVLPADVVVAGIGVQPRTGLAAAAGLPVDDGILVDVCMRTVHPAVFAAGDAVRMLRLRGGRAVRLESFTAAGRQGEVAATVAMGGDAGFDDVPWSWSDQYDATMQVIGMPSPGAEEVSVGGPDHPVVLSLHEGRLVGVCGASRGPSVARPVRAAGPLIAAGGHVDLDAVRAAGDDLAALARLFRDTARAPAPSGPSRALGAWP